MTPDEQSIEDILRQLETGWNARDSHAFAAPFAEDVTFIQIFGGQLQGRTAVEASHRIIFDTIYRESLAKFTVRGIRFVRPDVAILFAQSLVEVKEGDELRKMESRPTLFLAKEAGHWQIVAFQNTRISEMPAIAQAANRLTT